MTMLEALGLCKSGWQVRPVYWREAGEWEVR